MSQEFQVIVLVEEIPRPAGRTPVIHLEQKRHLGKFGAPFTSQD
jgi:hypothetical protein